ncbi:MAG: fibronectin type III domain-containing protein [Solirubrobacteraceae bacterium]|nr:fibronectin type III domain-containing protein [Solirubrobacteraceae bacterium]
MPALRSTAPRRRVGIGAAALAATAGCLVVASPATADIVHPVTLATSQTTTMPGTTRIVDEWKLVGRGGATAVQIAPRWVLSTDHSSVPEQSVFRNGYGAATVVKQYRPTYGVSPGIDGGYDAAGIDLTLHLLSAAIPAPSFPKLMGHEIGSATGATLPGQGLAAGFGGVPLEEPRPGVEWFKTDRPFDTEPSQYVAINSGSPHFWYPTPSSPAVLTDIVASQYTLRVGAHQPLGGFNREYGENVRDFMSAAFAANPGATPPQFTTLNEILPSVTGPRPTPISGLKVATPGASTVKLSWTNPPAGGVARTGFRVYVDDEPAMTLGASATSVTLRKLSWLTRYHVRVVPTSAVGEAYKVGPGADTLTFKTRWLF